MNLTGGNSGIIFNANSSYESNVSAGLINGVSPAYKFGHNEVVGTSWEDILPNGGLYAYPPSATTMTLSSSDDTADNDSGTGALTVKVSGLDATYADISEIVTLTGQTGATTSNSYLRIQRLEVESVGSGGYNAGTLYIGTGSITTGVPAVIYAEILPLYNQSTHGMYTVPLNTTAYIHGWEVSSNSSKSVEAGLFTQEFNSAFKGRGSLHFFEGVIRVTYEFPLKCPTKCEIAVRGKVDATTAALTSYIHMEIKDD